MKVAIDASNIRAGGGVTHLVEMLKGCSPEGAGIEKVIVFGGNETINKIPDRPWLEKRGSALLRGGSLARFRWRQSNLTVEVSKCADVLLVPGGSYIGAFHPFVALAQNLLPFDDRELGREGITLKRFRLQLLKWIQSRTFRRADGVIFMTAISRSQIENCMGYRPRCARVIHHGTSPYFFRTPKPQRPAASFSNIMPFRLLYLSILEPYKHQEIVLEAVARLRRRGLPVALDLVGPGTTRDKAALAAQMHQLDPAATFLRYNGVTPYAELNGAYEAADAFVFASSCETFGIILLEAMAGGLPLVCSHRSAMPEVVGTAALFFDPLDSGSLAAAIERLYRDVSLRRSLSYHAQERARMFSWEKCANETFDFVREVHDGYKGAR